MIWKFFVLFLVNITGLGGARLLLKIIIKAHLIAMVFLSLVAISVPIKASTTELTATRIAVNPFDGRKNGSGDWVGAWIFLQNVRIDGKAVGKSSIGFEFSGNFPNKPIRSVGFASVRSFTDMPKSVAERTDSLGHRIWIGGKNTREEAWKLY